MITTDFRLATRGFRAADIDALASFIDSISTPGYASGPTAAALHRFDGYTLKKPFDVVVLRNAGRGIRRAGHRVHTTVGLDPLDIADAHGIPVLSPTRTIIDLARTATAEQLTSAIHSALRDGGSSEDFLFRRIGDLRSSGRHGIPTLLGILEGEELGRGGMTWLEREVRRLLSAAGLPTPRAQVELAKRAKRLIRVDFWFPGTNVVLEALGYRWHRSTAQMDADARRLNRLQLDGFVVLQVTYQEAVRGAESLIADLGEALHQARRRSA